MLLQVKQLAGMVERLGEEHLVGEGSKVEHLGILKTQKFEALLIK